MKMNYVFSAKAMNEIDFEDLVNEVKGSCFRIMPKVTKATVINLGMSKKDLIDLVNLNYSLNVFDKDFNVESIINLSDDVLIFTNDNLTIDKKPLIYKIKNLLGKKKIIALGESKKLIEAALNEIDENIDLIKDGDVYKNDLYKIYAWEDKNLNKIVELV